MSYLLTILGQCSCLFLLPIQVHAGAVQAQGGGSGITADKGTAVPAEGGNVNKVNEPEQDSPGLEDLAGQTWILSRWNRDEPAPAEPEVSLEYREGKFTGAGGCNRYFAEVKTGEAPGLITVGPIGATRMACPPPADRVESRFHGILAAVTGYLVSGDTLELIYKDGNVDKTMLFKRQQ